MTLIHIPIGRESAQIVFTHPDPSVICPNCGTPIAIHGHSEFEVPLSHEEYRVMADSLKKGPDDTLLFTGRVVTCPACGYAYDYLERNLPVILPQSVVCPVCKLREHLGFELEIERASEPFTYVFEVVVRCRGKLCRAWTLTKKAFKNVARNTELKLKVPGFVELKTGRAAESKK